MPDQFLYVAHEDFVMMNVLPDEAGRLWIQVGEDNLSILSFLIGIYQVAWLES